MKRTPYKPEPAYNSSSRIEAAVLPNGHEVVLFVANGRSGATWGVRVFRNLNGAFTIEHDSARSWTARGEAAARAEFARLTATSAAQVLA